MNEEFVTMLWRLERSFDGAATRMGNVAVKGVLDGEEA
jgi:hypothetical protein